MVRDVARPEGVAAVAVHHLSTGFGMALRADAVVPPASLFKVGLMVATMRDVEAGRLALERELAITEEDWAPGAGILQDQVGGTVTVEGALRLMIGISDNVAAFVLLRAVGASRFNAVTASLGMARTRFYVDGRLDETSAGDMATVLAHLAAGGAAGADSTRYMVALLLQRQAAAWIRDALPPGIRVAHKSGQLPGTRNDAAIVSMPDGEYVVAVLTSDLADDRDGETYVAEVARTVHRHFSTGG